MTNDWTRGLSRPSWFTLLASLVALLVVLGAAPLVGGSNQWDFRVFYCAIKAFRAGLDPYNHANAVAQCPLPFGFWQLRYPYHPVFLWILLPWTFFAYTTALKLYLLLYLATWMALLALWLGVFLRDEVDPIVFLLVLFLGFDSTLLTTIQTGNLAIVEILLIWLALTAFIRMRPVAFTLLIVSGFLLKVIPLLLLPAVLLISGWRQKAGQIAAICAAAVLVWVTPFAVAPGLMQEFLKLSGTFDPIFGRNCPSTYVMIREYLGHIGIPDPRVTSVVFALWLVYWVASTILVLSRYRGKKSDPRVAFLLLLTYAIICPRLRSYALLALLPVASWVISRCPGLILINLLRVFESHTAPYFKIPYAISEYHSMVATIVNWGFVAWVLLREDGAEPDTRPRPVVAVPGLVLGGMVLAVVGLAATTFPRMNRYIDNRARFVEISGLRPLRMTNTYWESVIDMGFMGYPIRVNRQEYPHGIAGHAPATLLFDLGNHYQRFSARIGVLDSAQDDGTVRFRIDVDGRTIFTSPEMIRSQDPVPVTVDLKGVRQLTLALEAVGNPDHNHGVWLEPELHPCKP